MRVNGLLTQGARRELDTDGEDWNSEVPTEQNLELIVWDAPFGWAIKPRRSQRIPLHCKPRLLAALV